MSDSVTQDSKQSRGGTFAAFLILGILFFTGALSNFIPPPDLTSLPQETGTLIGVSDSKGRFGNNTTLSIVDEAGEHYSCEIKSSLRLSAIRAIRATAREHVGSDVHYKADGRILFEMTSSDGTVLLSSNHIHEQRTFTAWGMGLSAMFFWGVALFLWRGLP